MAMAVSIEETCRKLDVMTDTLKARMAEQQAIARKSYHREFGIFMPNLCISAKYPEGDVVYKESIAIYRDANSFIDNLKAKRNECFQFKAKLVPRYCFQGWAADWFFDLMEELQDLITSNLDTLCNHICRKYEQEWRKEQQEAEQRRLIEQQQAEEARIAKEKAEAFACRRCPAKFPSNTKLHQHIQDHHQKKAEKPVANEFAKPSPPSPITSSEIAIPTPEVTPKALTSIPTPPSTPKAQTATSTPSEPAMPTTPIATPRKPISWAEIASRPVIAPKPSRLPVLTPKRVPNIAETAPITYPPTAQTPKPKAKHQKPYLTIEDLFEMFAEKPMKTDLLHTKKTESSPKVSYQATITAYFKPAANQSTSISQGSKTPNPRSLHQHTPAETIRPTPNKWSEKSAILPYKFPTFSRRLPRTSTSEISSISPYKSAGISRCKSSICSPLLPAFNVISASPHACRICSGTFGSNNGVHRHLRAIHFGQASRRGSEKRQERGRNLRRLGDH